MRIGDRFHAAASSVALLLAGSLAAGCADDNVTTPIAYSGGSIREVAVDPAVAAFIGGTQHTLGSLGLELGDGVIKLDFFIAVSGGPLLSVLAAKNIAFLVWSRHDKHAVRANI